ncbi:uncharacterized protein LOC135369747 [Ornithodoros turicata]|uniref:uncharacterized protein LOC135369747 n=1 Tax=Ornithodoros turicata TaxID=34597 RepID=UPI00313974E0
MLLSIIDRFTRWPQATLLQDGHAETVADALLRTWFSRYGVPDEVVTARVAQFESALFAAVSYVLNALERPPTTHVPTCSWSAFIVTSAPASGPSPTPLTGPARCHSYFLFLRSCLKPDLGCSAAELVFGTPLRLPAELVSPQASPPYAPEYLALLCGVFKSL